MKFHTKFALVVLAAATMIMLPATALAQGPSVDTYGGTGGEVESEVGGGGTLPSDGDDLSGLEAGVDSGGALPGDTAAEEGTLAQSATGAESDDEGGTLPFTGSDTLILGLGGLLLVAVGAAIGKLSARMRETGAPA
jgi:hypothetical protein